jgi:uncharacterized protein YdeI (BOF family)
MTMESKFALQRKIIDIKNTDERIQVTGYIKKIEGERLILDDETGNLIVDISDVDFQFKKDDLVNVFGDLEIKVSGEKNLKANIIQDMGNLNFKYYKQLYEMKKQLE